MIPDLFTRFESNIRHDAHSFVLKVGRSEAGKQIVAQGPKALPMIVERLEKIKDPKDEVSCAWCWLISSISTEHNLGHPSGLKFGNQEAWIAWVKSLPAT